MGLFDSLRRAEEKVEKDHNERQLSNANSALAASKSALAVAGINAESAHDTSMMAIVGISKQRDEALEELAEARRIIETLRMEARMLNVIGSSMASGLERATLDVAQLTGIAPSVVEGRYQATVIDEFRANSDDNVLPVNANSTWGNTDIAGRMKEYLANSIELGELKAKGVSHHDAYIKVMENSTVGVNILGMAKSFKWLGNDAEMISRPIAEVMADLKPLDDAMIVAINLNSKITPAGSALHSIARDGTQSATRFYDALESGSKKQYFSVHTELQQAGKWRMDTERRKVFSAAENESNASGLLNYLSKVAGVDVSDNSAVKPVIGNASQGLNQARSVSP